MYKLFVIVLAVLAVVFAGSSFYFYKELSAIKKDPQVLARDEVTKIVALVGKLIMLPDKEVPTVVTVMDPEILKTQDFFLNAKKGDKVLIYVDAKKAILYNIETNKIINVAPVVGGASDQAASVESFSTTNVTEPIESSSTTNVTESATMPTQR